MLGKIKVSEKIEMKEKNGSIFIDDDRSILISISAFSTLRRDLIKNIGRDRMKGFLNRYGWDLGGKDAEKALKLNLDTIEDTIYYGPAMHMMKGHVKAEPTKLEVERKNGKFSVHMEGTWEESYEAVGHLEQFGKSKSPVCYTLVGYASGYLTKICNQTVVVKEVACQAKGDATCKWIGKSLDYWKDESIVDELKSYERTPIVKELEETYEKLLEERNNLEKSSIIHQKLTREILRGNDLQSIVKTIYETTKIPGMVVDQTYFPLAYGGLSFKEVKALNDEFKTYLRKKKSANPIATTVKIALKEHTYLIAPIFLQEKIIGYCFFVYPDSVRINDSRDEMILEQIALVSSLSLLIEKTKFDTERRIQGRFLEGILKGEYENEEEVYRRGLFIHMDLSEPYRIIAVNYETQDIDMHKELIFHEELLEATIEYFSNKKENMLIGHKEKRILFLVPESEMEEQEIKPYFNSYLRFLSQTFSATFFAAGISNLSESIIKAKDSYRESLIALRMATPNKRVVCFDSIGVIGPLLNENNQDEVKKISCNVLGALLDHSELLETLYAYLLNGGNLEQTSTDIALSLSGLRYRLAKIERLLGKDLREPFYNYQLLLALQTLILIGEIKVNGV